MLKKFKTRNLNVCKFTFFFFQQSMSNKLFKKFSKILVLIAVIEYLATSMIS